MVQHQIKRHLGIQADPVIACYPPDNRDDRTLMFYFRRRATELHLSYVLSSSRRESWEPANWFSQMGRCLVSAQRGPQTAIGELQRERRADSTQSVIFMRVM